MTRRAALLLLSCVSALLTTHRRTPDVVVFDGEPVADTLQRIRVEYLSKDGSVMPGRLATVHLTACNCGMSNPSRGFINA